MNVGKLVGVVVVMLALTGCSAGAEDAPAERVANTAPSVEPTATEEPVTAPIEMPAAPTVDPATPWGEAGFESADAWFLASMDAVWVGERPTDAELLGAGALACEQIASGTDRDTVVVVSGDDPEGNNIKVVDYAVSTLCP
jgi:hypothetical protein